MKIKDSFCIRLLLTGATSQLKGNQESKKSNRRNDRDRILLKIKNATITAVGCRLKVSEYNNGTKI